MAYGLNASSCDPLNRKNGWKGGFFLISPVQKFGLDQNSPSVILNLVKIRHLGVYVQKS